ncbi:hypothetical protein OKW98_12200 [Pseudomonas sp. KU26590]|uniref:hypothetical protein n=1 Tax=Pseudomonas sp. KU26590 TaxID=2991051 RepID=UPI00223D18BF|nr:hypothetical protein [Pseudomonas sp. KU26590]UZJ62419.1 hypothetical protein OKW98_12200 [Pseudomonas sp. KU26590]
MPLNSSATSRPPHLDWMAQTAELGRLRIDQLILPGAHNAGSDKLSPNFAVPQEMAQDLAPLEQLRQGVRALDLRVAFYSKYEKGDARRFQLFHLTSSGRTVAGDILACVHAFFEELEQNSAPAREIVILDFHLFKDFTESTHREFQGLITTTLGSRAVPRRMGKLTLENIWRDHPGKHVVLAYNHRSGDDLLWPGVKQRWPGANLFNTNTLKAFVNEVALEYKPPFSLTAIQCAKYSLPLHAASDLSQKIDQWFASTDENSFIQNFYIINTDWTLRSALVAHCRHANAVRARLHLRHPELSLQPRRRVASNG